MTSSSLLQTILSRTTIHDYTAEPLPEGALETALEAALAAPNHRMTEPWNFVAIGPETRRQLAEIAANQKAKKAGAPLGDGQKQGLLDSYLKPAALLAVVQTNAVNAEVDHENYAAIACGLQNASLVLWELGIGSKWSTGAVTTAVATYELLGVPQPSAKIVGFFWVGVPAARPVKPRRRRGLAEVLRRLP